MHYGASSPLARPRARSIDLNVIPPEYRVRPFPYISAGLAALVVGGLLLLYAVFYSKAYSDLEVQKLQGRVAQAQTAVAVATVDPAADRQRQQLAGMRDDYRTLAERQVDWASVFQTIAAAPSGVQIQGVAQSG